VTEHVTRLLPLDAAGALDPDEAARVASHLATCGSCRARAAEWSALVEGLRRLPASPPEPALAARTLEAAEIRMAERAEQAWNRTALGFLVAFAWTLAGGMWVALDLLADLLALRLDRPVGSTGLWFAAYLAAGWLPAAAATLLLGRRADGEGRMA
jgi:anti-sigma factor RsiW